MRLVVIVSSDPSDLYFANQLARAFDISGIIVERSQIGGGARAKLKKLARLLLHPLLIPTVARTRALEQILKRKAAKANMLDFGLDGVELQLPPGCFQGTVAGRGSINSLESISMIRGLRPDLIVVCGASMLGEEVLSIPTKGTLNLHGGLSQRYRGVWTTHWALINEEPECVGATVHFVSRGIDDGDIVYQGRPDLDGTEDPESLYAKVVKLGVQMMIAAISDIAAGHVRRYRLETKGNLYLSSIMTPEVLLRAWSNVERGVIKDYLSDKQRRDEHVLPLMRGCFTPREVSK